MPPRFEFEPRDFCVCGASLAGTAGYVTKRFGWGEVSFARCAACGSWCQSPIVTEATLAAWIDSADYQGSSTKAGVAYANYAADEDNRMVEARDRYRRDLAPLLHPGSTVLEVGCATGSLLAVIRERGHEVMGVDLSANFVEAAKALHGLEVRLGDVLRTELPLHRFDAVLAMGTVSNFRDFAACLAKFRELLKPGGFLMFNFPDADSLWVRLLYRDRFWMYTPSVSTFLTTRGCAAALTRSGFRAMRIANDVQRPSLRKLLHHGKAGFVLPVLAIFGLADSHVPFAFPVPTIRLVTVSPV